MAIATYLMPFIYNLVTILWQKELCVTYDNIFMLPYNNIVMTLIYIYIYISMPSTLNSVKYSEENALLKGPIETYS